MDTYVLALCGGVIIAISTSMFLWGVGRILGISGLLGAIIERPSKQNHFRYAFFSGFLFFPFILILMGYDFHTKIILDRPLFLYAITGLLVGFGTGIGSGCTSGHGVCGLPRFAKRSYTAVFIFMSIAILTHYFTGFFL